MAIDFSIEDLIPHRAPMILIDEILEHSAKHLVSSVTIKKTSPFLVDGQYVPAWIGLEYMAQSIAAWDGIKAKQRGNSIKPGFLLGAKSYKAKSTGFSLGNQVMTEIVEQIRNDDFGLFSCYIDCQGIRAVDASVMVYQPSNI